ncbi:MAG: endonuclease VII domain-containing protein [Balneola sp.]
MSDLVYLKVLEKDHPEVEVHDVGKVREKKGDRSVIEFLRSNTFFEVDNSHIEIIDINQTGDRFEYKICDRCFKYLKTDTMFENNRIKKGGLITKRPSCRDCRKIKNGVSMSYKDRALWNTKRPKLGEVFTCPICKKQSIGEISRHVIDHDHGTGKVRGILCESCNTGIGRFDDDPDLLRNAIKWLEDNS